MHDRPAFEASAPVAWLYVAPTREMLFWSRALAWLVAPGRRDSPLRRLARVALARSASASDWIAQYVSAVPPFRHREFVYLLSRREMAPEDHSTRWHPPGEVVARQTCIAYRSVAHATGSRGMVRAIQYPSLDRITRYGSGLIRWEHIMAFYIAGVFPQGLTNALAGPAMEVLLQEALNMRKHRRAAPHPG